jgi:hypothetical protein
LWILKNSHLPKKAHNAHSATTTDERIEIDVLASASAGGMTAVIAAQNLLYARDSLQGPENSPFYNNGSPTSASLHWLGGVMGVYIRVIRG